jgi:O-antigen/teichoic acid export membrane protein
LAGGVNDAIDRQFLKFMLPASENPMEQLGIYFANLKIAVILIVFIQTFRFAAEPFFFNYEKEKDSKQVFADIMKYFLIFCLVIFIGTIANLSIIKYFIDPDYWSGLGIVPVVLLANLFVGVYLNLSIWYKLSGKTMAGAYIIVFGSLVTMLVNYFFVATYGYYASAYARLICYILMTIICFMLGQKYYPIPYDLRTIMLYAIAALIILIPMVYTKNLKLGMQLLINNIVLLAFIYFIVRREKLLPIILKMTGSALGKKGK